MTDIFITADEMTKLVEFHAGNALDHPQFSRVLGEITRQAKNTNFECVVDEILEPIVINWLKSFGYDVISNSGYWSGTFDVIQRPPLSYTIKWGYKF